MIFHVLPGDAVVDTFRESGVDGEIVVCRECLIDGPVKADTLDEFWAIRERFLEESYPQTPVKYKTQVVGELEKLIGLSSGCKVNLWFEHELFCQVNMWFCMDLLSDTAADVNRVLPPVKTEADKWKGFGNLTPAELHLCFSDRIALLSRDIQLGAALWKAYSNGDHDELARLSQSEYAAFPFLKEVCDAELAKPERPREILDEITGSGTHEFADIFASFADRAGVYGFGDAQVRRLLEETRS